ncbi:Wax synthase domain [Dillenia turbinata]|uniref:Wax synthase domain n=1 Tax=Dillenia turbinata TaxID=194707 RepID=A0AAN8VI47_9MAGN
MDGEINSFVKVWLCTIASLCYCYFIASQIPKGKLRLFSLLPIFYLFTTLPFNLSSFHLGDPTTFYLVWLGNFKLILLSFDLGPLSSNPPKSLLKFICLGCLPIVAKQDPSPRTPIKSKISKIPSSKSTKDLNPPLYLFQKVSEVIDFGAKFVILAMVIHAFEYKSYLHPYVVYCLYGFHMYLGVELTLTLTVIPIKAIGFEIEPQFKDPYLSTSLQDFWSHRWNLMVPSILRPTVFDPTRHMLTPILGKLWALLSADVAAFFVSGLMHEIMFYHFTRETPTWEVTRFFVFQGFCTAAEVVVKEMWLTGEWRLHRAISGPLTLGFLAVTGAWLFLPFIFRQGPLSSTPPKNFFIFVIIACLPIKIKSENQYPSSKKTKLPFNFAAKVLFLALLIVVLVVPNSLVKFLIGLELELPSDEPYLSTSLQDFWARRWNVMVSNALRHTVYKPVRSFSATLIGSAWAPLPGVLATFLVSGLMHELVYFYITRAPPSWEVTCYFLLHAVCLLVESGLKKACEGRFELHWAISCVLTVGFVNVTSFWLFFPPLLRAGVDVRAIDETKRLFHFVSRKLNLEG